MKQERFHGLRPGSMARRARAGGVAGAATIVAALALTLLPSLPADAQNRVYRCGNEYTNQLKGRTDCTLVEGGNVTIVESTTPRRAAPAKRATTSSGTSAAPSAQEVLQRRREADARAILEQELARAQKRQAELEAEYKDGHPDKIGGEARNYQKYLDRVANLEAEIERNQSDIEGIQRELERHN
ncbi:MAG: hypothetical protein WCZ18_11555 [Ottowia sp.]|nr:hypothetical protein [Ottowia sp.]